MCKYAIETKGFQDACCDNKYTIRHFLNCNTTFVVYIIACIQCSLQYVGCTKRKLKTRISEHLSNIQYMRQNVSGAAKHFIHVHNGSTESFVFYSIEKVTIPYRGGDWRHKLLYREAFWILELKTRFPTGLNFKSDLLYLY